MAIKKVKLPNNTVVDINDARIPGVDNAPTSGSSNVVTSGGVATALGDKYEKPATGIPASDIAAGVIPSAPGTLNTTSTTAQPALSNESFSSTITLHKVAKTGTYSDLLGKPTIDSELSSESTNAIENATVTEEFEKVTYIGTTLETLADLPDIKYIQDKGGEVFYPVTHESGVRDSNGTALPTKLSQILAVVGNLSTLVATLDAAVEGMSSNEAVIAWDGDSTPVVANIPAGVTAEYNGTTYTGTLTASSSTSGKTYFVGEEGSDTMQRYITVKNGNNYLWIDYGSTDIDLSDYERKDDNIWLTEDEFDALTVKDPTKTYNVYEEVSEL